MSAPVIQMRDLAFGWPDGPLLFQGLDLTIAAGEVVARTLGLPEPERRAEEALARVGLAAQRNTHPLDLHAGARRLLALAAAIARRPPILLLDEAQRALDDHSRRRLSEITAIEADRGAAIVIVSHDRRFLESLATREVTLGPDLPESPRAVP